MLWSKSVVGMILFLNLFEIVLWPIVWLILEYVPCVNEKNVSAFVVVWWNVL